MHSFIFSKSCLSPKKKEKGCLSTSPLSSALLAAHLIPAAISSGSALSHLINRNLCYNDLSMSLSACICNEGWKSSCLGSWLWDIFAHFFVCLWLQHPSGQCKARTLLLGHAHKPDICQAYPQCDVPTTLISCCFFQEISARSLSW